MIFDRLDRFARNLIGIVFHGYTTFYPVSQKIVRARARTGTLEAIDNLVREKLNTVQ